MYKKHPYAERIVEHQSFIVKLEMSGGFYVMCSYNNMKLPICLSFWVSWVLKYQDLFKKFGIENNTIFQILHFIMIQIYIGPAKVLKIEEKCEEKNM